MLEKYLAEYGYSERQVPEIAGKYEGKGLVVCGDAACVWDDLERFGCKKEHMRGSVYKDGFDFLTINKLVEVFPANLEHAYSNSPALLNKFIAARRDEYRKEFEGPRHTHSCQPGAKWHWPTGGHATSALGATLAGVAMGYKQVVLCGVPLDNGPHNGEPPWRKCRFIDSEVASQINGDPNRYWQKARDMVFKGRVRSMSGRTMEWLGAP